jgi:integrase
MSKICEQIEEYLEFCVRDEQSQETIKSKKWAYGHLVKWGKVSALENFDNEAYYRWLDYQKNQMNAGPRALNTRISYVRSLVKYHDGEGMDIPVRLNKIKNLKVTASPRRVFYTREQINKVLDSADTLAWLLIKICFDTGMRITELRNMKLSQMTGMRIDYTGKGNKARESYLSQECYDRLRVYVKENGITDYLWERKNRRVYTVEALRIIMRGAFERVGITNFYPHALRHSCGSDIQARGGSIEEAQQILGHNSPETTRIYCHADDGRVSELARKYRSEGGPEKDITQMDILLEFLYKIDKKLNLLLV